MATPLNVRNAGAKATVTIGPSKLVYLSIINNQGAAAFIQLFNALIANVTLGTTAPDLEVQVAANSSAILAIAADGVVFSNGIVIGSATTEGGGTASAAGVIVFLGA